MNKFISGMILMLCVNNTYAENDQIHWSWLDKSVSLQKDFYQYTNGSWQKENPIPSSYPSWNWFSILQKKTNERIHTLLKEAAESTDKKDLLMQKIGNFYASGMDMVKINQQGLQPIQPELDKIQTIQDQGSLQKELTHLHQLGISPLFSLGSMQDFKHSKLVIAAIGQGILGLPDRDYYLKNDAKSQQFRKLYLQHIQRLLILSGSAASEASIRAEHILSLETQLAKAAMSRIKARQPMASYHMVSIDKLQKLAPNFQWADYLQKNHLSVKELNLIDPTYIKTVNQILVKTPLAEFKDYFQFVLVNELSSFLSEPFLKEDFKMTQALTGTQKLLPRWEQVVKTENSVLGHTIGELYIKRYFNQEDKLKVIQISTGILTALKEDIRNLPWMAQVTKKAALNKLAKMTVHIAYPEKSRDYSLLKIEKDAYVLNILRASNFLTLRDLNKIGKPVDKVEWNMTPQTINASYDPSLNTITIPAGILQPPFYNSEAPDAFNYGGLGYVVGHEITHGFDDVGSQFDAEGNLKNWWTSADRLKFNKATQCIIKQFSNYEVSPGLKVKGKLVVGEATADLGGLTLAFKAFQASPGYAKAKTIDGPEHEFLTPDQQFFMSASHIWAGNIRPEYQRVLALTDPHPPIRFRVNGTLANMPEFAAAFHIAKTSPSLNRVPCKIW
jgi:putative endopeptidase